MKTIRLFGLIMLTALVFSGCSKSDDDNSEKKIRANAKGIYLDGSENKEIDLFLWINNDVMLTCSDQKYLNLNDYYIDPYAYHPLTKETLYQIVCEIYDFPMEYLVQHKEDWPEIRMGERNLSKYKYIVNYDRTIILFNRTSSVNYYFNFELK